MADELTPEEIEQIYMEADIPKKGYAENCKALMVATAKAQLAKVQQVCPELKILGTNPYWDAPDESAEGIYEAGKEAQLEDDRRTLATCQGTAKLDRPDREKIAGLIAEACGYFESYQQTKPLPKHYQYADQILDLMRND